MIITGIAHNPGRLHEKTSLPSADLVYLALRALRLNKAKRLVTSLSLGWDQALARAALELKIPFTVAIPYPGRDAAFKRDTQVAYYELLSRADEVYQVSESYCETAVMDCHIWRVEQADKIVALWDFEFRGDVFRVIDYALRTNKEVVNYWQDWTRLCSLRSDPEPAFLSEHRGAPRGAQIYPSNDN